MKNIVLSTRNTTNARKKVTMALSAMLILLGIFIVILCFCSVGHINFYDAILLLLIGFLIIGYGTIKAVKSYITALTYLDVYDDRFIGKGIQNMSVLGFNIKLEEINNVAIERYWLHIQTSSGVYKVMTDNSTAAKVFNYCIELKN